MRQKIIFILSFILVLGFTLPSNAQEFPGEMDEELQFTAIEEVALDCQLFENADYYIRFVYLYAGQHNIAGRVKITVFRRGGEFTKLRISLYSGSDYGWEILESHLYVGTEPPGKMAPGKFPYKQKSPSGLDRHDYYIDLDDIAPSFEHVFLAVHAEVQTTGVLPELPAGQKETAWGFKCILDWYPVMAVGEIVNPFGEPWGTIFPKKNKQWPAYFLVYIPYNVECPWFECPQPLQVIYKY